MAKSYYDPEYHRAYRNRPGVREKKAAQLRAWKAANADRVTQNRREWQYRTKYGIEVADYDRMLAEQDGRCKVCRTDDPGQRNSYFCVDHRHVPGFDEMSAEDKRQHVRGLLCVTCNLVVGKLEEHPGAFESYIAATVART